MAKYTRSTLTGDLAPVNSELEKIENSLADKLDRNPTAGEPNQLETTLDANSNRIINLSAPVNANDAARLKDVEEAISAGLPDQTGNANKFLRTDGNITTWDFVPATSTTFDDTISPATGTTVQEALDSLRTAAVENLTTSPSDVTGALRAEDAYDVTSINWHTGNLPVTVDVSNSVTFPADIYINDGEVIAFGNSQDSTIGFNGSNTIFNAAAGGLVFQTGGVTRFSTAAGGTTNFAATMQFAKATNTNAIALFQPETNTIGTTLVAEASLECRSNNAGDNHAFMAFHRQGAYATYFGLNSDNKFVYGGWTAGANEYEFYNEANPNTKGYYSIDSNRTLSKEAPHSIVNMRSTSANVTLTLDSASAWAEADTITIYKTTTANQLTITSSAANQVFFYPDNSSDTSATVPDGTNCTVILARGSVANQWSITVEG